MDSPRIGRNTGKIFFFKIAATNPTAYLLDYEISSVVDTVDSRARVSSMTGTLLFSMRDDIYISSLCFVGGSVTKQEKKYT